MAEEMSFLKDCYKDELENTSSPVVYTRMEMLLSFINTLEVKEVDLEKEIGFFTTRRLLKKRNHSTGVFHLMQNDVDNIAKYFFELGMSANNKAQKGEEQTYEV